MTEEKVLEILQNTDYTRTGGTPEELKCAEYLAAECGKLGVTASLEAFPVQLARIRRAELIADDVAIPCKGFFLSGCADVEAPLYYMPNVDRASIAGARGKVVMLDVGMSHFLYQDLYEAGAVGFITHDGNVNYAVRDIDQKELRPFVSCGKILPGVNINVKDAMRMMKDRVESVRIVIDQEEWTGESHNVIAEIPGETDEYITFTAHYDSTSLSRGAYDNMSGCIGLLGLIELLKATSPNRYGAKFIFCGSEERGLLGSKAWTAAHEGELTKCALNINLDMIGSVVGKMIAKCTCEQKFVDYITYRCLILGIGMEASQGVYASDSTPFADKGVPAVSFARLGGDLMTPIHNRYDNMDVMSADQTLEDISIIGCFAEEMINAAVCPVSRTMPENVKKDLDIYLYRTRKE